jgi:hypothetical protein
LAFVWLFYDIPSFTIFASYYTELFRRIILKVDRKGYARDLVRRYYPNIRLGRLENRRNHTLDYFVSRFCPSSGILNTRTHYVSETSSEVREIP